MISASKDKINTYWILDDDNNIIIYVTITGIYSA